MMGVSLGYVFIFFFFYTPLSTQRAITNIYKESVALKKLHFQEKVVRRTQM